MQHDTPALAVWLARHAAVPANDWKLNDLWRAACWEQVAVEATADGLHEWAEECRQRARVLAPHLYKRADVKRAAVGPSARGFPGQPMRANVARFTFAPTVR